ncbi:MAG: hypothetical protein LC687_00100 [Actinobacteria bacterium]|nr:hypothetical protein [Actinomycetota bacterium]
MTVMIILAMLVAFQLALMIVFMRRGLPAILEALGDIREAQLSLRSRQTNIARQEAVVRPIRERNRVDQAYEVHPSGRQSRGLRFARVGGPGAEE